MKSEALPKVLGCEVFRTQLAQQALLLRSAQRNVDTVLQLAIKQVPGTGFFERRAGRCISKNISETKTSGMKDLSHGSQWISALGHQAYTVHSIGR